MTTTSSDDTRMAEMAIAARHLAARFEELKLPGYLGVVGVDAGGVIHYASDALDGRFGISMTEALGHSFLDFLHADDITQAIESFAGVPNRSGHHQSLELRLVSPYGQVSAVDVVADNHLDDPTFEMVAINVADPRDRLRSAHLLSAQARIVREIALGGDYRSALVAILDFVQSALPGFHAIAYVMNDSARCQAVTSGLPDSLAERLRDAFGSEPAMPSTMAFAECETVIAVDLAEPRWAAAREVVGGKASSIWSVPVRHERGAASYGVIDLLGPHFAHPRDEDWAILELVSRLAAVAHDHSQLQDRLRQDASIDPLTATANRRRITQDLATAMETGAAGHVVCFIDIDRLKVVNDGLGHEAGDSVIREAAARLRAAIGAEGTLGRFGGDEFVALIRPGAPHEQIAQRCLDAFAEPMWVVGRAWQLSISLGIVVVDNQRSPGEVLRDADAAMYEAKRAGRGCWRLFGGETRRSAVRRLSLEHRLRATVGERGLEAWFQPIVRAGDWSLMAAEALARWRLPDGTWVSPVEFIPLAEELGLIDAVGDQMVDHAVRAERALHEGGAPTARVSINVSPLQLQSEMLFDRLDALRGDRGVLEALCLEMTEQQIIDDSMSTLARLERLLALGVTLAVDDFGTGYSSLSQLHRLPAAMLKVDRGLVSRVGSESGDAVLAAAVGVARAYGMTTVAEGVETAAEAMRLRELGLDGLQGFLFARPAPIEDLLARIAAGGWMWDADPAQLNFAPRLPLGA